MPTHLVAHLLFFTTHRPTQKKSKELPSQHTMTDGNTRQTSTTEKNNEPLTAPWQKSGFCGYIKFCASNKLLWWVDSFVLLNPLLRQAANR
jgi:hypothetical protein